MKGVGTDIIGKSACCCEKDSCNCSNGVDNLKLIAVNEAIQNHPVEVIGKTLRGYMTAMKSLYN